MPIFTLEALEAKKGDSLILHYGNPKKPELLVIDGGPAQVYAKSLKPRLKQILSHFKKSADDPLSIDMVMVSHIDDDHIHGILDWFGDLQEAKDADEGLPFNIQTLWFNSFDDVTGNAAEELRSRVAALAPESFNADPERAAHSAAIIASVPQGRKLRAAADNLAIAPNDGFKGMVMSKAAGSASVERAGGLKLTVLAPNKRRLADLNAEWETSLKKKKSPALTAAFVDKSVANLSSIVVLAELGKGNKARSMLLTGDARGDDVLAAVKSGKLLAGGKLHVDLLKFPHHGSNRNVAEEFFATITADHYVISADGEHGNPDPDTLAMLAAARGDEPYTVHLTNEKLKDPKTKRDVGAAVKKVLKQTAAASPNREIKFRQSKALSIKVDLLDELPY